MRTFIALTKVAMQTGPDIWDSWTETRVCTEETTLGELRDWYLRIGRCCAGARVLGVEINEPEPSAPEGL